MFPAANLFGVSNGVATDPLEVFRVPPNIIVSLAQAAQQLAQQQKPGPSSSSSSSAPRSPLPTRPSVPSQPKTPPFAGVTQIWRPAPPPQRIPVSTRPFPQPPGAPAPQTPQITDEPPNPGEASSTVSYPGMGSDASNNGMPAVIGSGLPDLSQIPQPGDGSAPDQTGGVATSTLNTGDGYWTMDGNGNSVWVPGASDVSQQGDTSGGLLDLSGGDLVDFNNFGDNGGDTGGNAYDYFDTPSTD